MEQLGIEPLQILAQIFNFTVLVILLNKLLYKPILKALEERKKKIKEGLDAAEKMKAEEEISGKKREEIIKKARLEASQIIEEGKKAGKLQESEIIEKAVSEKNSILEKGREELQSLKKEMVSQLRKETVDLAKSWVEAILARALDNKSQLNIINKKILELSKTKNLD